MFARVAERFAWWTACFAVVLIWGCAHSPEDPRERLVRYRLQAGSPVAAFDYVRNMRWEALGDQAVAVWPRRDAGFLVEMASPCSGLDEARSIQITHGEGRVRSRIDGIRVLSLPGAPPLRRPVCPILLISPIGESAGNAPGGLRPVAPDNAP